LFETADNSWLRLEGGEVSDKTIGNHGTLYLGNFHLDDDRINGKHCESSYDFTKVKGTLMGPGLMPERKASPRSGTYGLKPYKTWLKDLTEQIYRSCWASSKVSSGKPTASQTWLWMEVTTASPKMLPYGYSK
jgi:hypothetical protein